jgi:SAM-dependent methyltransferase
MGSILNSLARSLAYHSYPINMLEKPLFRDSLRQAYDKYAQERDSSTIQDWKAKERSGFLLTLKQESKKRLLEIGSGPGRDGQYFQDNGFEVVCIDLSPAMVELCKQKGLTAYVMDMSEVDLPENSFDAVYSMNSLLHLTKNEFPKILHRINTLIRTDGMAYLGIYGGYDYEGTWEKDPYTPKRFFSFFSDEHLEQEVTKVFDILVFNRVIFEPDNPIHFQSLMLKKKSR